MSTADSLTAVITAQAMNHASAARPSYSALSSERGIPMPPLANDLERYLSSRIPTTGTLLGMRSGLGHARQRSKVETVEIHHLGPGRGEVIDELFARIGRRIHFGNGAQLGV